ncbi:MAG: S8 family serine peptidase [Rhodobacter sp.]|nr:S8 family serine peptidase [Paracoccaceae bacterium]MCC0075167.1 S8 family serine peptidase [Rhodobacter sp.]
MVISSLSPPPWKRWLSCIAAAAVSAALTPGPAPAQSAFGLPTTTTPAPSSPSADGVAALVARARSDGSVRVIVGLRVPVAPEGTLDATALAGQRDAIAAAQEALLARFPALTVNRHYRTIPYVALTIGAEDLEALSARPDVTSIVEDAVGDGALDRSTRIVGATRMWRAGHTGEGWAVAVLDTGIQYRHVAFDRTRIPASACFSSTTNVTTSLCPRGVASSTARNAAAACDLSVRGCGHGTHVAAIAAGAQGRRFRGVAPDASLIPIQIFSRFNLDSSCSGAAPCARYYNSDLLAGLEHVLLLSETHRIAAVNMSLQGSIFSSACPDFLPAFSSAAQNLLSRGVIPVAASGNSALSGQSAHPACDPWVLAVAATDDANRMAVFSNLDDVGAWLAAPGVDIEAAFPPGRRSRGVLSGTSMAAPHVAGAIALLREVRPQATPDDIFGSLHCTGVVVAREDFEQDFYRINIPRALQQLRRGDRC